MSKCLFLFPTPEEQVKITSGGPSSQWYGCGIPYIMSYVEQYGHETDAILEYRCSFDDYFAMVIDKIITFNPEFVAMQMYSTNRVQCYQIAEYLHKNCPDIQIIWGGHHASVFPEQLVKAYPYVVVVIGEGEETVKEVLDHKPYHAIDGICWFDSGINQVAIQNPRQLLDVNLIPFPKHDVFFRDNPDRTMVCTMTSRGCPFHCKFCCLRKLTGNKIRYRSVENIIDELDHIKRNYPKVETIVFQDDAFTLNNQRVIDLAKKIVERDYGFKFQMASVAYPASEEMLYWMEKAGLEHIYVGLENGNQAILDKARKNLKLEDVESLFKKLAKYPKLVVSTYLITGLPGETWETVKDTVRFIKKLQRYSYDFVDDSTIIWLYPGTELYYEAVERGEITDDYWLGDGPCPTWTGEHTVEELQEMRQYLLNRVSFLRIFTPIGFFSQMTNAPLNVLKFIWYHPKWVKYAVGESVGYMFPRFYEWVRGYKIQRRNTG